MGLATHVVTMALIGRRTKAHPISVVPELIHVVAKTKSDQQPVEFTLINQGKRPVTIRRLSSNCSCVAVGDYEGTVLASAHSLKLTFAVRTPEYGVTRTRLEVIHDGDTSPVEMYVEAAGNGSLPVVRDIRNGSPTFLALRSLQDSEQIAIRTFEPRGGDPWIVGMECDLEFAAVELVDRHDEDRPTEGLLQREYTFRLSWKHLPTSTEFMGQLRGITKTRDATVIPIGTVSGRLANAQSFSPSVARLVPGEHPREIVVFDSGAGTWAIARDAQLPRWLETEWSPGNNSQRLVLSLRGTKEAPGGTYKLPLENRQGDRQLLTIVRVGSASH